MPDIGMTAAAGNGISMPMSKFTLADLEQRVSDRASASSEQSYTRQLLDKGVAQCAKKFGEEAVEAVLAVVSEDRERVDRGIRRRALSPLCHAPRPRRETRRDRGLARNAQQEVRVGREGLPVEHAQKIWRMNLSMEQRTDDGLSPYRILHAGRMGGFARRHADDLDPG